MDFGKLANRCSEIIGTPWFFMTNLVLCILALILPQFYDFSITLISVVTYLIAILIQRTQNQQEAAMQIKLDEIVRGVPEASDNVMGIEKGKMR